MKMTLRQKAYQTIKNKIIYFELRPGEKVLESTMARLLNIGRVPIREAFVMLEKERLLIKAPGYGYNVTKIIDSEIDDYRLIRTSLELIGASLFIERATNSDIQKIKRHVQKAEKIYQNDDIRKTIEHDTKFHDMIYQGTKSDVFYQTIASLTDKTIIMRAAAMHTKKGRDSSINDHIKMTVAMENRDLELMQQILEDHLKFAPQYYESIRSFLLNL